LGRERRKKPQGQKTLTTPIKHQTRARAECLGQWTAEISSVCLQFPIVRDEELPAKHETRQHNCKEDAQSNRFSKQQEEPELSSASDSTNQSETKPIATPVDSPTVQLFSSFPVVDQSVQRPSIITFETKSDYHEQSPVYYRR